MLWWEILLIVFAVIIIFIVLNSLAIYFLIFMRLFELNFNLPLEFKLSEYRENKQIMLDAFNWYDNQKFKEIEIKNKKLKLKADYLKTNNSDKLAILFHGYRSSARNDFGPMILFYQKLGYNILIVNQRCHGKSKGKIITFGIKESEDCKLWVDYAEKKYKPREIILAGVSMGASTLLFASDKNFSSKVKCIIADCGFVSPEEEIKYVMKFLHIPIYPTFWFAKFWFYVFTKLNISHYNTLEHIKNCNLPILFIHGKKDKFVPYKNSLKNFKIKKDKKVFFTVERAPHGGCYVYDTKNYELNVKKFLKKYI